MGNCIKNCIDIKVLLKYFLRENIFANKELLLTTFEKIPLLYEDNLKLNIFWQNIYI